MLVIFGNQIGKRADAKCEELKNRMYLALFDGDCDLYEKLKHELEDQENDRNNILTSLLEMYGNSLK